MKVKMKDHLISLALILQILGVRSLIVPEDIPTVLSVIYSNIPILKKGTDSRLGWGFRLGDRADFQIVVELGPQKYTQPLAKADGNANNKRNAVSSLADVLYAQRQNEKRRQNNGKARQGSESEGGKWLETWSNNVQQRTELPSAARPGIALGEIDAKSVIPDDTGSGLTELYSGGENATGSLSIDDKLEDPIEKLTELYHGEATTKESESRTVQGPE